MPTSESREKWLTCKLDRGMFSDEVAVTYPPTEHWQKSVFVPSTCVRNWEPNDTKHEGEVKVVVLVQDGSVYAVLPSPQRDIVRVNDADLRT
jgi:hypothetical protein